MLCMLFIHGALIILCVIVRRVGRRRCALVRVCVQSSKKKYCILCACLHIASDEICAVDEHYRPKRLPL